VKGDSGRGAQSRDYAQIATITEGLLPGGTRATQLAAAAITHTDEVGDLTLSIREIERSVPTDNPI